MQLNLKYASALVWVFSAALIAGIVVFATGNNALALVVLAIAVVGYMIYSIGKSGLPGAEPIEEQEQKEHEKDAEKLHAHRERIATHP